MALARLPEAQLAISARAASSGLAWGATGNGGVVVVGMAAVVVIVVDGANNEVVVLSAGGGFSDGMTSAPMAMITAAQNTQNHGLACRGSCLPA